MSDTGAVIALFVAAMIGAGFVGQLLGEALIRFAIWKGWLPQRTIIMRFHSLSVEAAPASRQKEDTHV